MSRFIGVVGILAVLAGFRILWQARAGFYYWLETYARLFGRLLREPDANRRAHRFRTARSGALAGASRERHTLRLVVGSFLVFLLGPALIALGLTL